MVEYGQLSSEAGSFPGTVLPFPPRFPIWLLEFAVFLQLSLELAAKARKGEYDSRESLLDGGNVFVLFQNIINCFCHIECVLCVCVCKHACVHGGGRGRESEAS